MSAETQADGAATTEAEFAELLRELTEIRGEMLAEEERSRARLEAVHPDRRESARNLLHYIALRRRDRRPLQTRLAALGLSSLGRAEAQALATIDAVLDVLHRINGNHGPSPAAQGGGLDFARGERLLAEHAEALLGPKAARRDVRIMVTMPSEAADDPRIAYDLLAAGMDVMRINCAHDDAAAWERMIEHLRSAESTLGRKCKVAMDLGGPKLRTGPLVPGPQVVKVRPERDVCGRVSAPARAWFTSQEAPAAPPAAADATLPVPPGWLAKLKVGDRLRVHDARDAKRTLYVSETTDEGCFAEAFQTAYFVPGTVVRRDGGKGNGSGREAAVGALPALEQAIVLKPGDRLVVTRDAVPGRPALFDAEGRTTIPAAIGCTLPEVFDDVREGESIWFDDGKIGGRIESIEPGRVIVRIERAKSKGDKLRGDKGINLPESALRLAAMTEQDVRDLPFVAEHADVVDLSFANTAADVESLHRRLEALGRSPAVVLKIETRRGFENLPEMLFVAMQAPCCGVMIARGDLAVECGFERLAEVQEQILWFCEAAHVPVIWATQVLESLAKDGLPSRAEVTDAAMGNRAECVMLNKGPHAPAAVRALDDILQRMEAHQDKKRSMLRELRLAHMLPDIG